MDKQVKDIIKKADKFLEGDKYPEMTEKAVKELWNNDKYSKDGLLCIAFTLLKKVMTE